MDRNWIVVSAVAVCIASAGGCTLNDLFFQRIMEAEETFVLLGGNQHRAVLRQNLGGGFLPIAEDNYNNSPAFVLDISTGARIQLDDAIPSNSQCDGDHLVWLRWELDPNTGANVQKGLEVMNLADGRRKLLWPGLRTHDRVVVRSVLAAGRVIAMLRTETFDHNATLIHDIETGEERLLDRYILIEQDSAAGDVAVIVRLRVATAEESASGENAIDVIEFDLINGETRTVGTRITPRYRPTDNFFVSAGHVVWMEAEPDGGTYSVMNYVRATGDFRQIQEFVPSFSYVWLELADASDAGYVYQLSSNFPNANSIVFQPFEGNAIVLEGTAKSDSYPGFVGERILWSELASTGYRYYDIPSGEFGWY